MKVYIDRMAWIAKADLSEGKLRDLRQTFTLTPKKVSRFVDPDDIAPIRLYEESPEWFGMPRAWFLERAQSRHEIVFRAAQGGERRLFCKIRFEGPFAEGGVAVETIREHFLSREVAGGILQASCGFGKTLSALALIWRLGTTACVIVNKNALLSQWYRRILKFMPGIKIGVVRGRKCEFEGKDIVLMSLQSLAREVDANGNFKTTDLEEAIAKYPPELWSYFGLVIADECFPSTESILMADGTERAISDVRRGERVLNAIGVGVVTGTGMRHVPAEDLRLVIVDGIQHVTTKNHPFLTEAGWVAAADLIGKSVLTLTGRKGLFFGIRRVESVSIPKREDLERLGICVDRDSGLVEVYNLSVSGHPSYVLFSGVVVHNCHRLGARSWNPVMQRFTARWRLGLTATPRRKDGMESAFYWHIGPILYAAKTERPLPLIKRVLTDFSFRPSKDIPYKIRGMVMLKALTNDLDRQWVIVRELLAATTAPSKRKILLLAERKNHLLALKKLFEAECRRRRLDISTSFYVASLPDPDEPPPPKPVKGRKPPKPKMVPLKGTELIEAEKAQVIFATNKMAEEGLDIQALDTLVLASPLSDVEQAVGRIRRECLPEPGKCEKMCAWRAGVCQGKPRPVVVDLIDAKEPECGAKAEARNAYYRSAFPPECIR